MNQELGDTETEVHKKKKDVGEHRPTAPRRRRRVKDAVLHLIVSMVFSCALGLFFIHTSMLWHQYRYGYGIWSGSTGFDGFTSMDQSIFTFARRKSDIYEWSGGQLRVNTSLYVW
jgi:hypothetical protein